MTRPAPTHPPAILQCQTHEAFRDVLAQALVDLTEHYGIPVSAIHAAAVPVEIHGHQVAGIIGFAGNGFGGTVAVRAGSALVRACLPIASTAKEESRALGDWISELSNQLLGRTKNKLIRFGQAFHITPPTYAAANELIVVGHDPARTSWLSATTRAGHIVVMLELHVDGDYRLVLVEQDVDPPQPEGELILF